MKVAALYVETNGHYYGLEDVDPWDEARDARKYAGNDPVVAHPPCQRWGRYWSGGPNPNAQRRKLGDDDGCFVAAWRSLLRHGGVLEHPEASHAWGYLGLARPAKSGGWLHLSGRTWTCCVEQGHYGHPARKATWLLYVGEREPFELIWGPSKGVRLDEGFHSKQERERARAAGQKPRKRLSTKENLATPIPFRDLLLSLARWSRGV